MIGNPVAPLNPLTCLRHKLAGVALAFGSLATRPHSLISGNLIKLSLRYRAILFVASISKESDSESNTHTTRA